MRLPPPALLGPLQVPAAVQTGWARTQADHWTASALACRPLSNPVPSSATSRAPASTASAAGPLPVVEEMAVLAGQAVRADALEPVRAGVAAPDLMADAADGRELPILIPRNPREEVALHGVGGEAIQSCGHRELLGPGRLRRRGAAPLWSGGPRGRAAGAAVAAGPWLVGAAGTSPELLEDVQEALAPIAPIGQATWLPVLLRQLRYGSPCRHQLLAGGGRNGYGWCLRAPGRLRRLRRQQGHWLSLQHRGGGVHLSLLPMSRSLTWRSVWLLGTTGLAHNVGRAWGRPQGGRPPLTAGGARE
eukprot:CAMPEP_0179030224 /NCGR_PEP_ID=MMETSP0796-20121207/10457_1 /TAXON_ID=73915 /ORGANISM="Pyrodinium bahamense, Strain pbaha01" /LENGTH=303 /DNA_ID=CAMNT_0020726403 /DNA_START=296 /DNA_END=1208 /DNA_ORIENTATION=-